MTHPNLPFAFSFQAAAMTDIGRLRHSNQDEAICEPGLCFFAVSDGMGGLKYGGETSQLIKENLPGLVEGCLARYRVHESPEKAAEDLASQIQALSDEIYENGNRLSYRSLYGATLCGVWLCQDKAIYVNLGDSRGYILRSDEEAIEQITEDQNMAWPYIQDGSMTKEEADRSPYSSRLTAFVGMRGPAPVQLFLVDIRPGDLILLASDGLFSMIPERDLSRLLRAEKDPEALAQRLVDEANDRGGIDNIGLVCLQVQEPKEPV